MAAIRYSAVAGFFSDIFYWDQTYICPEQSPALLFSTEAINLDAVTGTRVADSTLHRWVTGHEQALGPIRANVTNMVPGCPS